MLVTTMLSGATPTTMARNGATLMLLLMVHPSGVMPTASQLPLPKAGATLMASPSPPLPVLMASQLLPLLVLMATLLPGAMLVLMVRLLLPLPVPMASLSPMLRVVLRPLVPVRLLTGAIRQWHLTLVLPTRPPLPCRRWSLALSVLSP